ncbi:IS5/IS1182 family transposase, partial [Rhodovulum sulfidophilum]|nr:IS5/IS1182 family transposase [Rhodovulum sulfidophilum]
MTKPSPARYRTRNWSSNNPSLKQRASLDIWFDPDLEWHAEPDGR